MPKSICPRLPALLLALLFCIQAGAQRMFFNTTTDVYEIKGTPGNFTYTDLGHFCMASNQPLESLAAHGDTLYLLTGDPLLYQVILSTGSCLLLTNMFSANNLTCDDNGVLYYLAGDLFSYDPHTNTIRDLGFAPVSPDGDLVWYNGMLICSGNGAELWAIDPDNPSAAFRLMSTGSYDFLGLLEIPDNCQKNRLFGIDDTDPAHIVEIDPLTWTLGNVLGKIPNGVLDGASTVEDGTIRGVLFDSLALLSPCGNATNGSVQAFSSSAADGGTSYTLDGTSTNTTGVFPNVNPGTHTIHIEASPGCTVDSTFMLEQGLSSVSYQINAPEDCAHAADGSIQVNAASQALPILYSLDTNGLQPGAAFGQLDTGTYTLRVVDAGHCEKDTTITLAYQHIIPFPATLTIAPAICTNTNGSLALGLNSGVSPGSIAATIDATPFSPSSPVTGLKAGTDTLHVAYDGSCKFDSVVTIPLETDPAPIIQANIRDQLCFTNNGNISLSIAGMAAPYLSSLNGSPFSPGSSYDGLAPAGYAVRIQDANGCLYDTSFTIEPYPRDAVTLSIDTVNPVCTTLNSGSLTITVVGDQAPYWLALGSATYPTGSMIGNLSNGDFILPVINKDGCVVDSAHAHLDLDILPVCEAVYIPNAFTPDGNGVNDVFRVLHSPYMQITGFRVFNRYGGLVFTGSDQHPGWDGTFHGEPQPAGTYVWEVSYIDVMNIHKTTHGVVLLIR
jgi:gliding motility-associated-like protein